MHSYDVLTNVHVYACMLPQIFPVHLGGDTIDDVGPNYDHGTEESVTMLFKGKALDEAAHPQVMAALRRLFNHRHLRPDGWDPEDLDSGCVHVFV